MVDEKNTPDMVELEAALLWDNFLQLWEELRKNPESLPPAIKELVMNAKRQIGAAAPVLSLEKREVNPNGDQTQAAAKHEVISAYLWHLNTSRELDPKGLPKRIIKILDAMLLFRNRIRTILPAYLEGKKNPKKRRVPIPNRTPKTNS